MKKILSFLLNWWKFFVAIFTSETKEVKIVICGPPHSGKSVFTSLLTSLLPRERYMLVEGAPDGEGITGWSHKGEQGLVKQTRHKGKFTQEFVRWVCKSVRRSTVNVTIIDVGGRRSTENEQIFRACNHFIVISSNAEETAEWITFGERLGLTCLAVLDSVLDGEDEIFSTALPLKARISKLDRDNVPVNSIAAKAVAGKILEVAGAESHSSDGTQEADVNFPQIAQELGLCFINGGPDRDWQPKVLPQLLQLAVQKFRSRKMLRLWGNTSNGAPYYTLACSDWEVVQCYDPKVGGYVSLPNVQLGNDNMLSWEIEERDGYTFVGFTIPEQIFDVKNLSRISPLVPVASTTKGVVLSGKGPRWLTATICRAYQRAGCEWVAVMTLQESTRFEDGAKWCDRYPNKRPAVVIASRDSKVPVGTVVPF